jgi:hypothetical protein
MGLLQIPDPPVGSLEGFGDFRGGDLEVCSPPSGAPAGRLASTAGATVETIAPAIDQPPARASTSLRLRTRLLSAITGIPIVRRTPMLRPHVADSIADTADHVSIEMVALPCGVFAVNGASWECR